VKTEISKMIALVQAVLQPTKTEVEGEGLSTVALFCGLGILVSLLLVSFGLDLSLILEY
jgi:hypothetical protein